VYTHVPPLHVAPTLCVVSQMLPQPAQFEVVVVGMSQPSALGPTWLQSA
jgi:hypothetical protein